MPERADIQRLQAAAARAARHLRRNPGDPMAVVELAAAKEAWAVEKIISEIEHRVGNTPISAASRRRIAQAVIRDDKTPQVDTEAA